MFIVGAMIVISAIMILISSIGEIIEPLVEEIKKNPKSAKNFIIFCVIFVLLIILGTLIDKYILYTL